MSRFKLPFTLVVATAIVIGEYLFGRNDDSDRAPPPRDPYHSSSSHGSDTTQNQTQRSYRPLPSYIHRPLVINAHSQTTPWTPAFGYFQTSSPPSRVHTGSEPSLPTAPAVVSSGVRFDKPAGVRDLEFAKKLREQARRKGQESMEAYSRAKSAQKRGQHGAAHAHREKAIAHNSSMKELDKQAAKIIFRENNKDRRDGMVDLHGLYVAEAVQFAKYEVQNARSRGDKVVRFIVGKGLHSDDGKAKIRPALEDHFTKRGLKHSLDAKNAGVFIVRLDRQ